jgi:predicted lipid-binding transport protein (Tim44 family)
MSSSFLQLLVLAGIAIFLILKLRSVLGTRDGFEKPPVPLDQVRPRLVETPGRAETVDRDITDHVAEGSPAAQALAQIKKIEPAFSVSDFLGGARGAYEMILIAFEHGELDRIRPFLTDEVEESFAAAIADREAKGLTIQANFSGIREMAIDDVRFDPVTKFAELTLRFTGELTMVVRNKAGEVVDGSPTAIKRQRDVWTFERQIGAADPNWQLSATGD